jgi:hypothetical protein
MHGPHPARLDTRGAVRELMWRRSVAHLGLQTTKSHAACILFFSPAPSSAFEDSMASLDDTEGS